MRDAFSRMTDDGRKRISKHSRHINAQNTHLVVRHTHRRHGVGIRPHIILHKLHPLLLEILTRITKRLPILLPFLHRFLQHPRKLRIIVLVHLHRLLRPLQLEMNLFQILALHERRLRGVRIDAQTVRLVLFARLAGMLFPRLFDLELLLDRRLIHLFVMLLFGYECADLALEVRSDLLREL